jgi:hypothetical protein
LPQLGSGRPPGTTRPSSLPSCPKLFGPPRQGRRPYTCGIKPSSVASDSSSLREEENGSAAGLSDSLFSPFEARTGRERFAGRSVASPTSGRQQGPRRWRIASTAERLRHRHVSRRWMPPPVPRWRLAAVWLGAGLHGRRGRRSYHRVRSYLGLRDKAAAQAHHGGLLVTCGAPDKRSEQATARSRTLIHRYGARERTRTFTPCEHYHLKVACLPISPPAHENGGQILPQTPSV